MNYQDRDWRSWPDPKEEENNDFFTWKRPGVIEFLSGLKAMGWSEIVVFTAGTNSYARSIVKALDPMGVIFDKSKIFSRRHCTLIRGQALDSSQDIFKKDLSRLGRNLKGVFFLDDKFYEVVETSSQLNNGAQISSFDFEVGNSISLQKSPLYPVDFWKTAIEPALMAFVKVKNITRVLERNNSRNQFLLLE